MAVRLLCRDQHIYDRFRIVNPNDPNIMPDAALVILVDKLNIGMYVLSFKTHNIKHVVVLGPNPTGEIYDTSIYTGATVCDMLRNKVLYEFEYNL